MKSGPMNRVLVTGGYLKGKQVAVAGEGSARYTPSKVREAIFQMLGDISGCAFLDLFAGSGLFSVEAISRGASSCMSVEADRNMFRLIGDNYRRLSLSEIAKVVHMDVAHAIPFFHKTQEIYDIIFLDPPYEKGYVAMTMALLDRYRLTHDDSIVLTEHSKREGVILQEDSIFTIEKVKKYGDTAVTVVRLKKSA